MLDERCNDWQLIGANEQPVKPQRGSSSPYAEAVQVNVARWKAATVPMLRQVRGKSISCRDTYTHARLLTRSTTRTGLRRKISHTNSTQISLQTQKKLTYQYKISERRN
jgi:hypothetical protein